MSFPEDLYQSLTRSLQPLHFKLFGVPLRYTLTPLWSGYRNEGYLIHINDPGDHIGGIFHDLFREFYPLGARLDYDNRPQSKQIFRLYDIRPERWRILPVERNYYLFPESRLTSENVLISSSLYHIFSVGKKVSREFSDLIFDLQWEGEGPSENGEYQISRILGGTTLNGSWYKLDSSIQLLTQYERYLRIYHTYGKSVFNLLYMLFESLDNSGMNIYHRESSWDLILHYMLPDPAKIEIKERSFRVYGGLKLTLPFEEPL